MSTDLVLVPVEERERRRIGYAMWIFGWRWRQTIPVIEHALQRMGDVARQAMATISALGFDYQRNLRYMGGHWYPVEHMPMTAREYRAWKRMIRRRG